MSGGVKVIIQDEKGKIYNLFPYHSALRDWFIYPNFDSDSKKVRNQHLQFILKSWEEMTEYLFDEEGIGSMKDSCNYSAPDWYGICFVSFKHLIMINLQDGSSVKNIVRSEYIDSKERVDEINSMPHFKMTDSYITIHYRNWLVIEHQDVDRYKKFAKSIMETCGIVFTPKEEKLWKQFKD